MSPTCLCTVDVETGLIYEHLPADRDAIGMRFEGWLCPHNAPVYLGEWRPASRIPTVDDGQRAAYALEAVQTGALPAVLGLDVQLDPDLPDGVAEIRHPDGTVVARITLEEEAPHAAQTPPAAAAPVRQAGQVPGRDRGQAGLGLDRTPAPAESAGGAAAVPVPAVPGLAPDQQAAQPSVADPVELPEGWTFDRLPVNPHRITVALDRAGLEGPTADAKLGAVEPALDRWEAGLEQPSAAQLERLAVMANVPIGFFWLPDDAEPRLIAARLHLGGRKGCQWVITMAGEPAGRPQEELPAPAGAEPNWWDV